MRWLALVIAIWAVPASAIDVVIEFRNLDTRSIDGVRFCIGPICSNPYTVTCGGNEICSVAADLPEGCYPLTARALLNGLESTDSEALLNPVFDGSLCHDFNGDGRVTGMDFGSFLEAFNASAAVR